MTTIPIEVSTEKLIRAVERLPQHESVFGRRAMPELKTP
jgi:hypothetical protein